MNDRKQGFFSSIASFFKSARQRKEHDIGEVTAAHFSGSVEGIDSAFEMHREGLLRRFGELRAAVAGMEAVLEEKRLRLDGLNRDEDTLLRQRDGAVTLAQQARLDGDDTAYERHAEAFERFELQIEEIEGLQAGVEGEIREASATLESSLQRVQDMRRELDDLSRRRTEAIADFVSNQQLLELDQTLHGVESSLEDGPLASVLQANRELSARARLAVELSGSREHPDLAAYEEAGRSAVSRKRLADLIEERPDAGVQDPGSQDPRPQI